MRRHRHAGRAELGKWDRDTKTMRGILFRATKDKPFNFNENGGFFMSPVFLPTVCGCPSQP